MEKSCFWQGKFKADAVKEVFSWREVNEIIFFQRIGSDRLRMSMLNESPMPARKLFSSGSDGVDGGLDHLLVDGFHELLECGATAVLDSVNETSCVLNQLAEDICRRYHAKCAINAYMSFGINAGFGAHHDDQDLIVVQIEGRKNWCFFGNANVDYADVSNMDGPSEKDISKKIFVERGDVLYVPKGMWHHAQGIGEPSLHLAIGLGYPTIGEFLSWVVAVNQKSVPFEDIKSSDFRAEAVSRKILNFLHSVCGPREVNLFLADHYSRIRCARIRSDVLNRFFVADGDVFARIPAFFIKGDVDVDTDMIHVHALGCRFTLSIDEVKLLENFLHGSLTYREVLKVFSSERGRGEIDLILKNLLKAGLITKIGAFDNQRGLEL